MLDFLRFAVSLVLSLGGLFVLISGVVGVFRFPYALSRIHAAALGDTVGIAMMRLGVMVAEGFSVITLKLLVVMLFLWVTSPVASHLIGRMEVTINDELENSMTVTDPDAVRREKEGN